MFKHFQFLDEENCFLEVIFTINLNKTVIYLTMPENVCIFGLTTPSSRNTAMRRNQFLTSEILKTVLLF